MKKFCCRSPDRDRDRKTSGCRTYSGVLNPFRLSSLPSFRPFFLVPISDRSLTKSSEIPLDPRPSITHSATETRTEHVLDFMEGCYRPSGITKRLAEILILTAIRRNYLFARQPVARPFCEHATIGVTVEKSERKSSAGYFQLAAARADARLRFYFNRQTLCGVFPRRI